MGTVESCKHRDSRAPVPAIEVRPIPPPSDLLCLGPLVLLGMASSPLARTQVRCNATPEQTVDSGPAINSMMAGPR
jgi:hypothetical protein